jgi:ELWxxDGT repeat protein
MSLLGRRGAGRGVTESLHRRRGHRGKGRVTSRRLVVEPLEDRRLLNVAPVANCDLYETAADEVLVVPLPVGVLANDEDRDGDTLTASVASAPWHGSLLLRPDGAFSYTPDADFRGTDEFTYWANDGQVNSNVAAIVRIRVTPPEMLREFGAVAKSSNPQSFLDVNGVTYFVAETPEYGIELWRTDGTQAGTMMVKDIYPDGESSHPSWLTNVNGTLFFTADDGVHGEELWKSDGTAEGTVAICSGAGP